MGAIMDWFDRAPSWALVVVGCLAAASDVYCAVRWGPGGLTLSGMATGFPLGFAGAELAMRHNCGKQSQ